MTAKMKVKKAKQNAFQSNEKPFMIPKYMKILGLLSK